MIIHDVVRVSALIADSLTVVAAGAVRVTIFTLRGVDVHVFASSAQPYIVNASLGNGVPLHVFIAHDAAGASVMCVKRAHAIAIAVINIGAVWAGPRDFHALTPGVLGVARGTGVALNVAVAVLALPAARLTLVPVGIVVGTLAAGGVNVL